MKRRAFFRTLGGFVAGCALGLGLKPKPQIDWAFNGWTEQNLELYQRLPFYFARIEVSWERMSGKEYAAASYAKFKKLLEEKRIRLS